MENLEDSLYDYIAQLFNDLFSKPSRVLGLREGVTRDEIVSMDALKRSHIREALTLGRKFSEQRSQYGMLAIKYENSGREDDEASQSLLIAHMLCTFAAPC